MLRQSSEASAQTSQGPDGCVYSLARAIRLSRIKTRWHMSVKTTTPRKAVVPRAAPVLADPVDRHLWSDYAPHARAWDELFDRKGQPHEHCRALVQWLGQMDVGEFQERRQNAELVFINQGITFSVYSDRRGVEKIFPFDLMPRPVAAQEWQLLESGLLQRIKAINLFLYDVYHDRRILREGVVPEELVLNSKCYRPEMIG